MKKLDRYVASYFITSFAVAFFFLIGINILFDALGKVDEFVAASKDLPVELQGSVISYVIRYYLMSIPYFFLQFAPFMALLACMFTGIRLAQSNELVPMVTAGVSLFRVTGTLFLGATLVAASMLTLREAVIPRIDDLRDSLRDRLLSQREERIYADFFLVAGNNLSVRCGKFYPAQNRVEDFKAVLKEGSTRSVISAIEAVYQDGDQGLGWYFQGGQKTVQEGGEQGRFEEVNFAGNLACKPQDLFLAYKGKENPMELSFGQLNELSLRDPQRRDYMTLLHYFLSFPLMCLILPLLGLPFVLRFEGRAASEGIGIAFLIFFAYFGADLYLRNLGNQGSLHPLIASWFPVVLFGSLGIMLFDSTRT